MAEARRRQVGWAEVVGAAALALREDGAAGLRFDRLAERLGTGVAEITYWFAEPHELVGAVMRLRQERFLETVWARLAAVPGNSARLRTALELWAEDANATYWIELWRLALRGPGARELRERLTEPYRDLFRGLIRTGVEAGDFDPVPVEMAALVITSVLASLSVQATLDDPAVAGDEALALAVEAAERLLGTRLR